MAGEKAGLRPGIQDFQTWIRDRESQHGNHIFNFQEGRESQFHDFLPYSDLSEWTYSNDEVYKASLALPVNRLGRVRQLSFLAFVGPKPEKQYLLEFNHTRLEHSALAAIMMEKVLRRNNASEEDVKLGVFSAMAHDQATPGLGEAAKKIDPVSLDEEDHWDEVMDDNGWQYLKQIGGTKKQVDDIIHNRGILGKVLDIVDRISYVMLDVSQIVAPMSLFPQPFNTEETIDYRQDLKSILADDTNVGSIYRDIRIDWGNNAVYFANPDRLRKLLEIRAILTRDLYMHPVSQARDMMVGRFISPYYTTDESDTEKLTPAKLRRMSDDEVIVFLQKRYPEVEDSVYETVGEGFTIYHAFVRWYPEHYETLQTREELERRKAELESRGLGIIGDIESRRFNPATEYKVMDDNGKIVEFRDYDPDCAGRIERIADSTRGFLLFWQEKPGNIVAQLGNGI